MAGNHTLGTIRGTIEIDYDGAGIVKAVRDIDKLKSAGDRAEDMSGRVLRGFSMFARGALMVSGAVGTAYNAVTILAGAAAILGPVLAAGFAAAPALILGYVSALVIAKVALAGVGDALAAAGEDAAKFEKAIEKLSPQAKAFARAYRASLPVLNDVKTAIQDAFFNDTAGLVGRVVNSIAKLQGPAAGVARRLSEIAQNIILTATNRYNIQDLGRILGGVDAFLAQIRKSIGPVVSGFIRLAAQGAAFGGVVGGALSDALSRFSIWLNEIDLAAVFERAGPILQGIGEFLSNVLIIARELFGLFNVDGASAAGVLGTLAAQLASFLQSAEGQEALAALGMALQAVAGAAGQIFLALLQALAPTIIALAPAIATLAAQIAGALVPALNAAAPLLVAIAGFLSENMSWIGPLAGGIVALAAAYRTYAAAASAVRAVQTALNATMLASAVGWLRQTAAVIASRVAMVAAAVASGVVRAATIAWTAVQWLLNAALTANPIGIVIVAIAALIAAIVLLWKRSETFRSIVLAVWSAIKAAIQAVGRWFTGTLVPSLQRAFTQLQTVLRTLANVAKAVWNAIKATAQAIWNGIVAYIRTQIRIILAVVNGVRSVINIIRNAFNSARNAVADRIGSMISLVRSLPGKISSALGNLGRLLYSKGVSLVQGFINGIAGMIGRVRDKARQVVSAVTDFLPGSPAKEGPLSGRGYALLRARRMMADFSKGIGDGSEWPVRAVVGAVTPMSRAMVAGRFTAPSGASTAPRPTTPTTGGGGTRTYVFQLGERTIAEIVVDAVTGNPVPVAKAVREGERRNTWSGSGRVAFNGAR